MQPNTHTLPFNFNRLLLAILSIIFLILIHIFIPNIGGVIARQTEYLVWIGMGAICLSGILSAFAKGRLIESPFKIYLLLFVGLLLLSSLFNPIKNMDMFVINSMRLLAGILFLFTLLQFDLTGKERLTILILIFISAGIESIIGVIQFFGLHRYIPVTPSPDGTIGGAFQQKNLFASWLATGLVASLYLITTNRFKTYNIKKILFFLFVAILSLNLIIANSRTGLIGTALGVVIILYSRKRHYLIARRYLTVWLMAFLIGIGGGLYLMSIKDRIGVVEVGAKQIDWLLDTGQTSYTQRLFFYRTAFEMFKDKPLFGSGFSNFLSLFPYYKAKMIKENPEYKVYDDSSFVSHPHNEPLFIISESGIVGLFGILILVYGFIKVTGGYGMERAGLYTALLTPLLFHSLVEFPLYLSTAHYLLFLILLFLATSHLPKKVNLKISPFVRGVVIVLSLTLYAGFTVYTLSTINSYNGFVRFYRGHQEGKVLNEEDILPATKNLYLRTWALPLYMFRKAVDAVKDVEKNREFLTDFLEWSSLEKQRLPLWGVFYIEGNILLAMGIYSKGYGYFDEAMRTVEEGLFLYPNNGDLKALRKRIVLEAFKLIFKR